MLPNLPPAEPYLYSNEQHGVKPPSDADEPTHLSKDKRSHDEHDKSGESDLEGAEEEREDPPNTSSDSSSSSSSSSDEVEEDPELEKLLREISETPSSSDDEEQPRPKPAPESGKQKAKEVHRGYDSPAGNISVLMVACWTLRLPVIYMDFIRWVACPPGFCLDFNYTAKG